MDDNVMYDDVGNEYAEVGELPRSFEYEYDYAQTYHFNGHGSSFKHSGIGTSRVDISSVASLDKYPAYATDITLTTDPKTLAADSTNPTCISQCADHFKTQTWQTQKDYSSPCVDQEGVYLDAATLHRSSVARGVHVLKSYALPRDQHKYDFVPEDIVGNFNRSDDEDFLEELTKYIVAFKAVNLLNSKDLLGLIILTKCRNRSLQVKLLQVIDELVYTKEVSRCNVDEILKSIYIIQNNMSSYRGDHDLLCRMVSLLLTLLCILYLWVLERSCDEVFRNRIEIACNDMKKIPKSDCEDIVLDNLLKSLRNISTIMSTKLMANSILKMGSWRDALSIENNRLRMIEKLESFSELEKCSCMFVIVNQMLHVHRTGSLDYLMFVHNAMQRVSKLDRKQKQTFLLPICIMMSKAVVRSVSNQNQGSDENIIECRRKLMGILSIFLDSKCLGQLARNHVLMEIKPLLFHVDDSVVKQVLNLLLRNSHQQSDILEMVVPHIESKLLTLNLNVTKNCKIHDYAEDMQTPTWKLALAKIAHSFEVDIRILWPTLSCIKGGSMHDYSTKADPVLTNRYKTHLDILHHLNESESHSNIIKLLAYQTRPLPFFFITEKIRGNLLSDFLLRRRKERHWLPVQNMILLATGVLNAIAFLHSKAIIHRNLTASQFVVRNGDVPVLYDFGMSLKVKDESSFATDEEENLIPLRWSSPESILQNRFDQNTDRYMAGMLLYEIFTHGCQPFTELYSIPLDTILEMILFQDLKPRQAPCIPRKVHELILDLTSTDNVCTLNEGLHRLSDFISKQKESNPRPSDSHSDDLRYPELDAKQGSPERVLPDYIRNFKVSGPNPRKSYFNLRMSQRKTRTVLELKESDLLSPDEPSIAFKGILVSVNEKVNRTFVENVMPKIQRDIVLMNLRTFGQPQIVRKHDGIPSLIYKCKNGENLIEFAAKIPYGDPYDEKAELQYLQVVYNLVEYVFKLHQQNFILRDICGRVIYLESDDNKYDRKVYSTRLGRMLYFDKDHELDECQMADVFKERSNWLPLETLDNRLYSFESDVYMLCMTIHEFYTALDVHRNNPTSNMLRCVPFSRVRRSQLREHLLKGEVPDLSDACPSWLYDEMKKCWNRDRTQRPSVKYLKDVIQSHLENPEVTNWCIGDDLSLPPPCSPSSSEYEPDTDATIYGDSQQIPIFKTPLRNKFKNFRRSAKYNPLFESGHSESENQHKDYANAQEMFDRNHIIRQSVRVQGASSKCELDCQKHAGLENCGRVHRLGESTYNNVEDDTNKSTALVKQRESEIRVSQKTPDMNIQSGEDTRRLPQTNNTNAHVRSHDHYTCVEPLKFKTSRRDSPKSIVHVRPSVHPSLSVDSDTSSISFANLSSDDEGVVCIQEISHKTPVNPIPEVNIEGDQENIVSDKKSEIPETFEQLCLQIDEDCLYLDVNTDIEFANDSTEVSENEQIVRTNYKDEGAEYIDFDRDNNQYDHVT